MKGNLTEAFYQLALQKNVPDAQRYFPMTLESVKAFDGCNPIFIELMVADSPLKFATLERRGRPKIKDVMCPNCSYVFRVEGNEYASKKPD